ncbi:MAG: hypothetical protein H7Z42_07870, partial [Roseiflexaceae bacterium]|nr:hypothetical protein [Roseiflexaceae bacterium]
MRTTYHYMRLFLPVALLLSLLAATVAAAPVPVARASSALSVYLSALANPEARTRNDLPSSGPGGLQHSAAAELLVTIRVADPGPRTQAALKQAGASIQ